MEEEFQQNIEQTAAAAEGMLSNLKNLSFPEMIQVISKWCVSAAGTLIAAILIFIIGRWIIKRINRLFAAICEKRQWEPSLSSFLKSLISITLNLLLILTVISTLGIQTSSFIAILASAGIAVGMALSGTLQNFAGGVMILLFKPFKVGDYIDAQGQSGTIKEIQIFNTILTTVDNKTIIIPNGGLSSGVTMNYSKEAIRRVDWTTAIAFGEDYDKAKEVITNMLYSDARVLKEPAIFIGIDEFANGPVKLTVRAWVKSADYWDVLYDMNERLYKLYGQNNINIPASRVNVFNLNK